MNTPNVNDPITMDRVILTAMKRLHAEINKTVQTTKTHIARLAALGKARWEAKTLERNAFDANVDLGRRMAELGVGDKQQRQQIAHQQESIRSLLATGARSRRAAYQLEVEEATLAQIELETRAVPIASAEAEYAAALTARDALQAQHDLVSRKRTATRIENWPHAIRLWVGYFTICLLLMSVGGVFQSATAPDHMVAIDNTSPRTPSTKSKASSVSAGWGRVVSESHVKTSDITAGSKSDSKDFAEKQDAESQTERVPRVQKLPEDWAAFNSHEQRHQSLDQSKQDRHSGIANRNVERDNSTTTLSKWPSRTTSNGSGGRVANTSRSLPPIVGSPEKTVHVRGYHRKDGTYVRPHTRRPPRR